MGRFTQGTGKWTAINSLDLGMPVTLIGESGMSRAATVVEYDSPLVFSD